MQKIENGHSESVIDINKMEHLNPEDNEVKCRICYEETMPLVTLCDCTGSIGYCHEDCILDWIAMKMEKSELIQIPNC